MAMKDHQYCYSEKLNESSTSHVQIEGDKVETSIETKCPICQEHHDILGLTDKFNLRIREDILILTSNAFHSNTGFTKEAFKIKYCPFCGRKL